MPQLDTVGVSIRQTASQITPELNYSNPDALFLTNTIYGSGYGKVPQVEDRLKGGKLAATIALPDAIASWAPDIDIGVNYADRRKVKTQSEGNILLAHRAMPTSPRTCSTVRWTWASPASAPSRPGTYRPLWVVT